MCYNWNNYRCWFCLWARSIYILFIWVRSYQCTGLGGAGLILNICWSHGDTGCLVTGIILIPCLLGSPRVTGTILNIPHLCDGSIMEPNWSIFQHGSVSNRPVHHVQHCSHVGDRLDRHHALRFQHPHPAAQLVPGPAERFCRFSL